MENEMKSLRYIRKDAAYNVVWFNLSKRNKLFYDTLNFPLKISHFKIYMNDAQHLLKYLYEK